MNFIPVWSLEGGGSAYADFSHRELVGTHGKITKSSDFSLNLLENNIMETILSIMSLDTMATQFSTPACVVKFYFLSISLQILTKYFKQLLILSLEVNFGILFEIQVTLHVIYDVVGIAQCLS